jgi:hypothetical protein
MAVGFLRREKRTADRKVQAAAPAAADRRFESVEPKAGMPVHLCTCAPCLTFWSRARVLLDR